MRKDIAFEKLIIRFYKLNKVSNMDAVGKLYIEDYIVTIYK